MAGRDYTRFYYDDVTDEMERLIRDPSDGVPGFTETDPHDPLIALIRGPFGFEAHRDAAMIDLAASEVAWPHIQRRPSAIVLAGLMGQDLQPDSPAAADVLFDIAGTPGPADILVPDLAIFRVRGDADHPPIPFEAQDGDVVSGALDFLLVGDDNGTLTGPVAQLTAPWATPSPGDAVYYGHAVLQFDRVLVDAAGSPDQYTSRFEYHDGRFRTVQPDSGTVTVSGSGIRMHIVGLVGTAEDHTGLSIQVRHRTTGFTELATLQFSGGTSFVITTGTLGQAVVSTDAQNYEVSGLWLPWGDNEIASAAAAVSQTVSAALPQDTGHKWQTTTVNGQLGYWVRERVISVGGAPVGPATVDATPPSDITWTRLVATLQGEQVVDQIGTTTGGAFDELPLNQEPFIGGSLSQIDVDGDVDWLLQDTLVSSAEDDKHAFLELVDTGGFQIVFGNGTLGRIPPAGSLVTATYRIGAEENGNVGVGVISTVEAGVNFVTNIRNPRPGTGWKVREGNDPAGLRLLRVTVPGNFRAQNRVVSPEDAQFMGTKRFKTADGRQPFQRIIAVEAGAGFKTMRAVCVGAGGQVPAAADVTELQTFYNGTKIGFQRFGGVGLANQEVVASAYIQSVINITATALVAERFALTAQAAIVAALTAAVGPLAQTSDGTYRWVPGSTMTLASLLNALGAAEVAGLIDITFSAPTFPITFTQFELPFPGTINVTVTPV